MKFRSASFVIALLTAAWLCMGMASCHNQSLRNTAASGDVSVATLIFGVQDSGKALYDGKVLSPTQYQAFRDRLGPALRAGRTFNAAVRAWVPGQAIPLEVTQTATALKDATDFLLTVVPGGATSGFMIAVNKLQTAIIAVLVSMGAPGSTPPPPAVMTSNPTDTYRQQTAWINQRLASQE